MKTWLQKDCRGDWKHLSGGDKHVKDFTIYLGSYSSMMAFVCRLESDPIIQRLDLSTVGDSGRIVGVTNKVSARFDIQGKGFGDWTYGWNGIPFTPEDVTESWSETGKEAENKQRAASRPRRFLKRLFGDYFLPESAD